MRRKYRRRMKKNYAKTIFQEVEIKKTVESITTLPNRRCKGNIEDMRR